MAKRNFTRAKMESSIEKDSEETQEKKEENEKTVSDAELERRTIEGLEGGTEDGLNDCTENLKEAQNVSSSEFDQGTNELQEIHGHIEEHKGEIHEGVERANTDIGTIDSSISELNSDSAASELETAKESARRDIEIMEENERDEEEIEQESTKLNEEHQKRVENAIGE
jgi:hypothetical protein